MELTKLIKYSLTPDHSENFASCNISSETALHGSGTYHSRYASADTWIQMRDSSRFRVN